MYGLYLVAQVYCMVVREGQHGFKYIYKVKIPAGLCRAIGAEHKPSWGKYVPRAIKVFGKKKRDLKLYKSSIRHTG